LLICLLVQSKLESCAGVTFANNRRSVELFFG